VAEAQSFSTLSLIRWWPSAQPDSTGLEDHHGLVDLVVGQGADRSQHGVVQGANGRLVGEARDDHAVV